MSMYIVCIWSRASLLRFPTHVCVPYICICICMYICSYICLCMYIYLSPDSSGSRAALTHSLLPLSPHNIYVYTCMNICVCISIYIHICTHTHTHTHTHTRTHTHTHTHTHTQPLRRCRQHVISTRPASMRMMCPVAQAPLAANTPAKARAGTRDTSVTISNT